MRNFLRYNTKKIIILAGLVILFSFFLVFPSEAAVPNCYYDSGCADYYPQYPYLTTMCAQAWCVGSCNWTCCCLSEDIIEPSAPWCCVEGAVPPTNCTCDEFYLQNLCCFPDNPVLCENGCWPSGGDFGCTGCNGTVCVNYQVSCSSYSCCSPNICRVDYDGSGNFCCSGSQCGHNNTCYANGAVSGSYQCSSGTWVLNVLVPTVITEIADVNLQNETATLKGNVTDTGGENPDHRYIDWDTDSGEPYANTVDLGSGGTGEYSKTIDITPGTIYYYRARAHNSAGDGIGPEKQVVIYTASGGQQQFTTLPLSDPPIADAGPDKEVEEGHSVILEGSGSDPNGDPMTFDWLCGKASTGILRPNAAGSEVNLTPADSTANYENVDEETPDGLTTYVKRAEDGYARDLYNLPVSSGVGIINKIIVHFICETGSTFNKAKASIKSDSTVADGDEKSFAANWTWYDFTQEWATNPADGEAWEWADIDALQIGINLNGRSAGPSPVYCTQVYVEINYTLPDGSVYPATGSVDPVTGAAQATYTAPSVDSDTTYTCTLTITDDKGLSDFDSVSILVKNQYTFSLSVSKAGTGSGTVTSNPTGINCGTDCSEDYDSGTSVTLTATPAADSHLAGWSGDCLPGGGIVFEDNFDPLNEANWSALSNASADTSCGSVSGNALYFTASGERSAATQDLDTNSGGTVSFYLKFGTASAPCENADANEDVVLEYSINGGSTWVNISTYDTEVYTDFTQITETIPSGAQTNNTRFRWRQVQHSGSNFDNWAIDNASISRGNGGNTCIVVMDADKSVTATFNLSDITPPTTKIKIIRTSTGEDVTAAGYWLRADTYTIEFEDEDNVGGSGLKGCEYYIDSCDVGGSNCTTSVVSLTARSCNWSFDITAGKTAPIYNLEGAGRYYIYSGATDNTDNPGTDYKYLNFDFTPPETRIE